MRCNRAAALDCRLPASCELFGCILHGDMTGPAGPGQAVALGRQPIDLPAFERPSVLARGIHTLERWFSRAAPEAIPMPDAAPPVSSGPFSDAELPAAVASVLPKPAAPRPAPAPAELRIVRVGSGWVIYADGVPADVAVDPAPLGAAVTVLVRR